VCGRERLRKIEKENKREREREIEKAGERARERDRGKHRERESARARESLCVFVALPLFLSAREASWRRGFDPYAPLSLCARMCVCVCVRVHVFVRVCV